MTNLPEDMRERIQDIIMSLSLGYEYQMSDYATNKKEEQEYREEGFKEVAAAIDAIMSLLEEVDRQARIEELHLEADRFRNAGYKGLPPGFQRRMRQLQSSRKDDK